MPIWTIRIFFWILCSLGGYALSQVQPEHVARGWIGTLIGFGFGGFLIALDEMLKGFSIRAFSTATFGLVLGTMLAWVVDHSGLFVYTDEKVRWMISLGMFLGFGYIGIILAIRSNKEDFSLIIPYVRLSREGDIKHLIVLDTSVIIDGRIAELVEQNFLEGTVVVPRFVLKELQNIADSSDNIRCERGKRGLEILARIQKNKRLDVKIHEGDFPDENSVDMKLVRLCSAIKGKLFTNDQNLGKIAELQSIPHVNLHALASALKPVLIQGDIINLKIVREGRDKGQGVGYMPDGTMVVVNQGHYLVGQQMDVQVTSLVQTGAGVIIFAELKHSTTP